VTDNETEFVQLMDELTQLAADWPAWKIWRAGSGSWMGTRPGNLTDHELSSGLARTLMEDTPEELRAQLEQQARNELKLQPPTS
jgi:hypothetical protein